MIRLTRYIWASAPSVLGLTVAALALRRGRITIVDGVVEAYGPAITWVLSRLVPLPGGAAAMTFGHVVFARDETALAATRAHERVHVAQYERWGPFFIPAYLLSGLWAYARGGHPYFDNRFEREAIRGELLPPPETRKPGRRFHAEPVPKSGNIRLVCRLRVRFRDMRIGEFSRTPPRCAFLLFTRLPGRRHVPFRTWPAGSAPR